jgi:hypothetical protein
MIDQTSSPDADAKPAVVKTVIKNDNRRISQILCNRIAAPYFKTIPAGRSDFVGMIHPSRFILSQLFEIAIGYIRLPSALRPVFPAVDFQIHRARTVDTNTLDPKPAGLFLPASAGRKRDPAAGIDHPMPGQAFAIGRRMQDPGNLPGLPGIARERSDLPIGSDLPPGDRTDQRPNPPGEGKKPALGQGGLLLDQFQGLLDRLVQLGVLTL